MAHRSRLGRSARRLGALLVALVIFLATGEGLAVAFYTLRDGFAWPGARLDAQRNAFTEEAREGECSYGDSLLPHPFLAFVQSGLGPCGRSYANDRGLFGQPIPDVGAEDTAFVLVTGGSVAARFVGDTQKEPSPLERILNREFAGGRFDRFVVLNGGHGAWKQPNQYILFGLYARVLDGVITLDGFNEHFMLGWKQRFERPSNNYFRLVGRHDPRRDATPYARAALELETDLGRASLESPLVRSSHLAYLIVDRTRTLLRRSALPRGDEGNAPEGGWVQESYSRMFDLETELGGEALRRFHLRQYRKYVRLIHAGAKAFDVPSLFLIQPTPAFGKPLTPAEEGFARRTRKEAYRALVDALVELSRTRGLPVHALLDAFEGVEQRVYRDAIHLNDSGNRILARRVAGLIEREWGWPRRRGSPEASRAPGTPARRGRSAARFPRAGTPQGDRR